MKQILTKIVTISIGVGFWSVIIYFNYKVNRDAIIVGEKYYFKVNFEDLDFADTIKVERRVNNDCIVHSLVNDKVYVVNRGLLKNYTVHISK
jgi:hypothetical protein